MDIQFVTLELKRLGMTQAEIARAIECSQPTVSDIQRGRIGKKRPSYRLVSLLLSLYQDKLAELAQQQEMA